MANCTCWSHSDLYVWGLVSSKNKVKVKDKKVNATCELLTLFGDKHTYSGAIKPGRKSTSVVLVLSSQQTPSSKLIT
ncbi:hypothetical protein MTR_2g044170 [Medicago truncatula]|uniref:Uncharacterized protein n=1 Tax=Medicago truncatula TaxID=3880 RepID=A0A072V744_MEDTR|nr:hypothetical protein MTR_2g044170 [Medicago truncatula]